MFTRTLAFLALIAGGLGALPHTALAQGTDAATISQAASRLSRQTPARVIRWLDTRRSVSDARIGSDGRSLEIRFRDGGSMAILPALGSYTPVSGASRLLRRHAFARSYQPSPNAPRALVLEPFATELGLGSQAGAPEITALQAAGFRVDQASDTQVTTGLMASLPNYNVVYMHTHTGVGPDGHGVLATGELASCNPYTSPDGTIQTVTVAGNTSQCYSAITSRYVALHFGQFPAHALVFLNGCALLNSTEFMQGLADKGVGVTLSWDNDSTARDGFLSGAAFFNEMGQGDSVSAALSALRNAGYGVSDVQGQTATLGYFGDATITLREAGGSTASAPTATPIPPTSTARPVATKTPTPAPVHTGTPTPRPTSTPVRAPSATATPVPSTTPTVVIPVPLAAVYPVVHPGRRQVVSVHSALAGSTVRIEVTFPDGKTLSGSVLVDASGSARYVFIQPGSTITRRHNTATVTIFVDNRRFSLHSEYRIAFGKIDVIAPRLRAAGKWVTIWVHTHKRAHVTIGVKMPHRRLLTMHRKTGAHGWTSERVRLTKGLTSGQSVKVHAGVRLHGVAQVASTRVTITSP